jgi:uncharacterized membrane protein YfcA
MWPADLSHPDLALLAATAIVAGLVRGFSGFGTALIYVPLAGTILPPLWVLVTLTVMDLIGPLPNLPRAWRDGQPRQVAGLGIAALAGLLPGLWLLDQMAPELFRWTVSALCLATVALMMSGWRWSGRMTPLRLGGIGCVSGFLGGISGLSGPPVVLSYMAAPLPVAVIRANVLMYLVFWDALFGATLALQGRLAFGALLIGAALIPIYLGANYLGAQLFDPSREKLYRAISYGLIALAAVTALPLWST